MSERQITAWSFSRLKIYETCPYRLWLQAGEKRDMSHVDTKAMDRGSAIHQEAEDYVTGKGEFTKNLAKFATYFAEVKAEYDAGDETVEEDWGFDVDWQPTGWWDEDVRCRIKLDTFRITARNDDGDPVTGIPTDYKTGKKFGNEVTHSQQGQLYAIACFLRYASLEVAEVEFRYLDHGITSKKKVYTREKAMKFLASWTMRAEKLLNDRVFKPKANKITCKWCPFGPQNGDSSCEWGVDG